MKVIFLKDIPRIGKKYDIKDVNNGYALNFLLPKKLVERATKESVLKLEQHKKEIVIEKEIEENLLIRNLEEIKDKIITIKCKANEKGSLFSSIHKKEILEAMKKEHNIEISEESIILEKPIKTIGEFEIPISIKSQKSSFRLIVKGI